MSVDAAELEQLIQKCLEDFYEHRLEVIRRIDLKIILGRKNPYLFRALATESAQEIIEYILVAYLSSSDETIFGNYFFEPIAQRVSRGTVAPAAGVDFAVETDSRYSAYAMKSGPNIFNSSQTQRQADEFDELRRRLLKLKKQFDPVLAAGYGRRNQAPTKRRSFRTASGQKFWEEITGDPDFYLKLTRLMKDYPQRHLEIYKPEWQAATNRLVFEFGKDFCLPDGHIKWEELTRFVSEARVKTPRPLRPAAGRKKPN